MRRALVKIDLMRLTQRLRASEGQFLTEWQLAEWLKAAGYRWSSGTWYFVERENSSLRDDEIVARQFRETHDGITFIDDGSEVSKAPPPP